MGPCAVRPFILSPGERSTLRPRARICFPDRFNNRDITVRRRKQQHLRPELLPITSVVDSVEEVVVCRYSEIESTVRAIEMTTPLEFFHEIVIAGNTPRSCLLMLAILIACYKSDWSKVS